MFFSTDTDRARPDGGDWIAASQHFHHKFLIIKVQVQTEHGKLDLQVMKLSLRLILRPVTQVKAIFCKEF